MSPDEKWTVILDIMCGFNYASGFAVGILIGWILWGRTKRPDSQRSEQPLLAMTEEQVEWVVNDSAELGVKISNKFFWLYKGQSLIYNDATHEDGTPMLWRPVGKREFGECCHPIKFYEPDGPLLHDRYTEELYVEPGLSSGAQDDSRWRPINGNNIS